MCLHLVLQTERTGTLVLEVGREKAWRRFAMPVPAFNNLCSNSYRGGAGNRRRVEWAHLVSANYNYIGALRMRYNQRWLLNAHMGSINQGEMQKSTHLLLLTSSHWVGSLRSVRRFDRQRPRGRTSRRGD